MKYTQTANNMATALVTLVDHIQFDLVKPEFLNTNYICLKPINNTFKCTYLHVLVINTIIISLISYYIADMD